MLKLKTLNYKKYKNRLDVSKPESANNNAISFRCICSPDFCLFLWHRALNDTELKI